MKQLMLAAVVAIVVSVSADDPARAQPPPCSASVPADFHLDVPRAVAIGRAGAFWLRVFPGFIQDGVPLDNTDDLIVSSADPARPYSTPYEVRGQQLRPSMYDGSDRERADARPLPLPFKAGDGPASVVLHYSTTDDNGDDCTASASATVTPTQPKLPRVRVHAHSGFQAARFTLATFESCQTLAAGRAVMTVRERRHRVRATLSDLCTGRRQDRGSGGFGIVALSATADPAGGFFYEADWTQSGIHRLSYTVSFRGRRLRRGRITTRVRATPRRRIYQGTDAFVNYCIRHNKGIRSSGGRLYCVRPGKVRYSTRVT